MAGGDDEHRVVELADQLSKSSAACWPSAMQTPYPGGWITTVGMEVSGISFPSAFPLRVLPAESGSRWICKALL